MMYTLKRKQTGISLYIVMIVVLLTAIVVAMGFKSTNFNELATGNTAEYQRTYEAAQALAHDAELDIQGIAATGNKCTINCRAYGSIVDADGDSGNIYIPLPTELTEVKAELLSNKNGGGTGCISGICTPLLDTAFQPYAFWENATTLTALKKRAARYGQFTNTASGSTSNPRLNSSNAWYWIEILPYDASSAAFTGSDETSPVPTDMAVIYRITALVEGQRTTRAVIQKLVVGKKVSSS